MDEENKEPEKEQKPNADLPTDQQDPTPANDKTELVKNLEEYTSEFIGPLPEANQPADASEEGYNPYKNVKIDNVDVIADDDALAEEPYRKTTETAHHTEGLAKNNEHAEDHSEDHTKGHTEDHNQHPVIIKKIKKIHKGGHHGGSWKIAYADFVTAMMAFFLIMWILALLNKSQLKSVSLYFKDPKEQGQVDKGTNQFKEDTKSYFLDKGDLKKEGRDKDKDKNKEKEKEKKKEDKKEDKKIMIQEKQVSAAMQMKEAEELKRKFEQELKNNPKLQQFKNNLNFVVTADGLKIIIKDLNNKPMFTTGKTDFEKYASSILNWLGEELAKHPNPVEIIGHTDSTPYQGTNYSNWELSADRANATRRALIKSGVDPDKFLRVSGRSDTDLLDKKNSTDPSNRRIEIVVLTDDAKRRLTETADTIGPEINGAGAAAESAETSNVSNAQPIFNTSKPLPANITIPQESPSPAKSEKSVSNGKPIPTTIAKPQGPVNNGKPIPTTIAKPAETSTVINAQPIFNTPNLPTNITIPQESPSPAKSGKSVSNGKPIPSTITKPQGPVSTDKPIPTTIAKPQGSANATPSQTPATIAKPQGSANKTSSQIPAPITKPHEPAKAQVSAPIVTPPAAINNAVSPSSTSLVAPPAPLSTVIPEAPTPTIIPPAPNSTVLPTAPTIAVPPAPISTMVPQAPATIAKPQ